MHSLKRIWGAGVVLGFLLNLLGWLGNAFLLRGMWKAALQQVSLVELPWRQTVWKELISLLPDFVYGVVLVWLYVRLSSAYGPGIGTAIRCVGVVFVMGVFIPYLGVANSGLLPWTISMATTGWALLTFVPVIWLLPRIVGNTAGKNVV